MISNLRIDHHDRSWTPILTDLVDAAASLREQLGTPVWVQMGWRLGPHALLCVWSEQDLTSAQRELVEQAAATCVAAHPSTHDVDHDAWVATSEQLGREELVPGPYAPLCEDNTWSWTDVVQGPAISADERVAAAKAHMLAMGGEAALEGLKHQDQRVTWALVGMAVLADAYPDHGMDRGYLSFLSHWKDYVVWHPAGEQIEAHWARQYELVRPSLLELLDQVAGTAEAPFEPAWRRWDAAAIDIVTPIAKDGILAPGNIPGVWPGRAEQVSDDLVERWAFEDDRSYSDFHHEFRKLDIPRLGNGYDFAAYRFTENIQFEVMSLGGVTPAERYAAAYMFSRAAQDRCGVTWQEFLAEGVRRQAEALA